MCGHGCGSLFCEKIFSKTGYHCAKFFLTGIAELMTEAGTAFGFHKLACALARRVKKQRKLNSGNPKIANVVSIPTSLEMDI